MNFSMCKVIIALAKSRSYSCIYKVEKHGDLCVVTWLISAVLPGTFEFASVSVTFLYIAIPVAAATKPLNWQ